MPDRLGECLLQRGNMNGWEPPAETATIHAPRSPRVEARGPLYPNA